VCLNASNISTQHPANAPLDVGLSSKHPIRALDRESLLNEVTRSIEILSQWQCAVRCASGTGRRFSTIASSGYGSQDESKVVHRCCTQYLDFFAGRLHPDLIVNASQPSEQAQLQRKLHYLTSAIFCSKDATRGRGRSHEWRNWRNMRADQAGGLSLQTLGRRSVTLVG
jgi:hypothetical protein